MDIFVQIFGEGKDLNILQMTSRGIISFFIALLLIRIAGRRAFGMKTAFDNIIALLLGAILSRAAVGASPFIPTVCSCLVIALLHRLFAILSIYSQKIGSFVKGNKILIYKEGDKKMNNMYRALASEHDLHEYMRLKLHKEDLDDVKEVYVERNGEISFLKKDKANTNQPAST